MISIYRARAQRRGRAIRLLAEDRARVNSTVKDYRRIPLDDRPNGPARCAHGRSPAARGRFSAYQPAAAALSAASVRRGIITDANLIYKGGPRFAGEFPPHPPILRRAPQISPRATPPALRDQTISDRRTASDSAVRARRSRRRALILRSRRPDTSDYCKPESLRMRRSLNALSSHRDPRERY